LISLEFRIKISFSFDFSIRICICSRSLELSQLEFISEFGVPASTLMKKTSTFDPCEQSFSHNSQEIDCIRISIVQVKNLILQIV
jgi:hypothetical protein